MIVEVDAALPVRGGEASSDILRSYLGLIVQGSCGFDAIEKLRSYVFVQASAWHRASALLPSAALARGRCSIPTVAAGAADG